MFKTIKYSGIITKTKALRAKLMSDDDYKHILSLGSVTEVISYLRDHPGYKHIFEYADENISHRGQLELVLNYSLYQDYLKLYRFSDSSQRTLLKLFSKKIEVNLLKAALRSIYSGEKLPKYTSMLDFVNRHSKVNFEVLYASKSPRDFIAALNNTAYYPTMSKIDLSSPDAMFKLESTLDITYFTTIWKVKDKLVKGSSLELMTTIVGSEIDLLNIIWIFRCKKYFRVDKARLYGFIIPYNYRLKKSDLEALIETSSIKEFVEVLSKTSYNSGKHLFDANNPEKSFYSFLSRCYKDCLKDSPISMAPVMDFLYCKEVELDILTTLIECIRYSVPVTDTIKYLDRYSKSLMIK